jgi:hypothetical protein
MLSSECSILRTYSEKALSQGTQDARLLYHAGAIALGLGEKHGAEALFGRAATCKQTLNPSERDDLNKQFAALRALESSGPIAHSN